METSLQLVVRHVDDDGSITYLCVKVMTKKQFTQKFSRKRSNIHIFDLHHTLLACRSEYHGISDQNFNIKVNIGLCVIFHRMLCILFLQFDYFFFPALL